MTVDAVGGVWQYACDLSAALRPLGVESVVALLGPPPTAAQRHDLDDAVTLVETGLELDWLAQDVEAVDRVGDAIASLAERLDVDLVHLNQPALAASACFVVPVVTTIHSCLKTWWQAVHDDRKPLAFTWQTALVWRGLRRADAVVAPSLSFAQAVQRAYELEDPPIVVPNGRRSPLPSRAAWQDSVFTAGRLWDKGKNIAILDHVAARLACSFSAAGTVRGPNGETIVLQHIEALGALDGATLAAHLAKRPIYVSAAVYEPFGLAVLEAAAAGCALVLSDIPTFREIWDGVAVFVEPSDEGGFVAAIETLLKDSEARSLRGERGRIRAAALTPARAAASMHKIYARTLSRHEAALGAIGV